MPRLHSERIATPTNRRTPSGRVRHLLSGLQHRPRRDHCARSSKLLRDVGIDDPVHAGTSAAPGVSVLGIISSTRVRMCRV